MGRGCVRLPACEATAEQGVRAHRRNGRCTVYGASHSQTCGCPTLEWLPIVKFLLFYSGTTLLLVCQSVKFPRGLLPCLSLYALICFRSIRFASLLPGISCMRIRGPIIYQVSKPQLHTHPFGHSIFFADRAATDPIFKGIVVNFVNYFV